MITNPTLHHEQQRAQVLAKCYEDTRRIFQSGYRMFKGSEVDRNAPIFKQCETVCNWLTSQGWNISWKQEHWQGYIKFVFAKLAPTIPHPGQLKNVVLLKEYLRTNVKEDKPIRTKDQVFDLYQRIVRKDISDNDTLMFKLGIRRD